jgi:hypothetical protein
LEREKIKGGVFENDTNLQLNPTLRLGDYV